MTRATSAVPPLAPTTEEIRDLRRFDRRHSAWTPSTSTDHTDSTEMSVLTAGRSSIHSDRASVEEGDVERALDDRDEEDAPLIASDASSSPEPAELGRWAVASLLMQHLSSTFIDGAYNFACFLFLIEVFTDSLVPASLVGFGTKLAGLALSGSVGGLVDRYPRLWFVRRAIGAQKCLQALSYGLFLSELPDGWTPHTAEKCSSVADISPVRSALLPCQ